MLLFQTAQISYHLNDNSNNNDRSVGATFAPRETIVVKLLTAVILQF